MDWASHYSAIYNALGVDADLTVAETGDEYTLRVIDKTAGVVVDAGSVGVGTIKPACCVRTEELASRGIEHKTLRRSTIDINGRTWRVESFVDRPSPSGLAVGELMILLSEVRDGS